MSRSTEDSGRVMETTVTATSPKFELGIASPALTTGPTSAAGSAEGTTFLAGLAGGRTFEPSAERAGVLAGRVGSASGGAGMSNGARALGGGCFPLTAA
jgi:hypothetical protein